LESVDQCGLQQHRDLGWLPDLRPEAWLVFVPVTTSFSAVTSASVAISIPTNVAEGTNTKCARYYTPIQGDYCNLVMLKFSISLPDFLILNPEINAKYVKDGEVCRFSH
jgi:hypothetical protein